jgi:hypothetical protein
MVKLYPKKKKKGYMVKLYIYPMRKAVYFVTICVKFKMH